MQSLFRSLDAEAAAVTASTSVHAELEEGRPPWCTLGEQFAILEDELRARIMQISQCDAHFTAEQAASRRAGAIVPHCMPMARASLAEDPQLAALRFRLVPRKLTEEEFWRCGSAAREQSCTQGVSPRHAPQWCRGRRASSCAADATSRASRRSRSSCATTSPRATKRDAPPRGPPPASPLTSK